MSEPIETMQRALIDFENKWKSVEDLVVRLAQTKVWNAGHAKLIGAKFKDDAIAILTDWSSKPLPTWKPIDDDTETTSMESVL